MNLEIKASKASCIQITHYKITKYNNMFATGIFYKEFERIIKILLDSAMFIIYVLMCFILHNVEYVLMCFILHNL